MFKKHDLPDEFVKINDMFVTFFSTQTKTNIKNCYIYFKTIIKCLKIDWVSEIINFCLPETKNSNRYWNFKTSNLAAVKFKNSFSVILI